MKIVKYNKTTNSSELDFYTASIHFVNPYSKVIPKLKLLSFVKIKRESKLTMFYTIV